MGRLLDIVEQGFTRSSEAPSGDGRQQLSLPYERNELKEINSHCLAIFLENGFTVEHATRVIQEHAQRADPPAVNAFMAELDTAVL